MAGSYYAQARQYMSQTGRFCGEDIIKGNLEEPVTLNRYTYCYNDPVKYVDLDGNKPSRAKTYAQIKKEAEIEHHNRNGIRYNGNTSQDAWIEQYGEADIIRDALNQATVNKSQNEKEKPEYQGKWEKARDSESIYHTNPRGSQGVGAGFNKKYLYVNADGSSYEVIIGVNSTGEYYIVKDPTNGGTFNYRDKTNILMHGFRDVLPYWKWGNSPNDKAKWHEKIYRLEDSCIR